MKGEKLTIYLDLVKKLAEDFDSFKIEQVPRQDNAEADALAYLGSTLKIPPDTKVPIIHILSPAINQNSVNALETQDTENASQEAGDSARSWMQPIIDYIKNDTIPEGENPKSFRMKVSRFTLIKDKLYRKSLAGPYLRCLEDHEAKEVLKDIHEGDCGNHSGARALCSKVIRTGYFWPTMNRDAKNYVQRRDTCQRHGNILHQPAEPMYPIVSPWPFMKWGMDIVGKLPVAPGGKVFMLAMTDYFSKWIEAEAFVQVKEKEVISFIKRNILTRFGVSPC